MNKKTFSKKFISILAFVLSFTFACSPLANSIIIKQRYCSVSECL